MTRIRLALLLVGLVVLASGCQTDTDDELAPRPTRTVTASPSQSVAPAPATIPVGQGDVSLADVVWAQGSVLHVGPREVDLSPVDIEAFLVVDGGVFLLSGGQLWFTDLQRLRGTGQTEVTMLRANDDASRLVVTDTRSGRPLEQGYDTHTGKAIRGQVATRTPAQLRAGPGRFVETTSAGLPTVVDATGAKVPLRAAPHAFELGAWAGDSVFYGVGREGTAPRSVVSCDAVARKCRVVGRVPGGAPVVFGTGK